MSDKKIVCSFCGATSSEVKNIIRGEAGFICDTCVGECVLTLDKAKRAHPEIREEAKEPSIPTPEEIVKHLDEYVIGQSSAKRILAVALYNHYKRIGHQLSIEIQKSNVLLIGPSGVGKTLLCSTLAKLFNVPFVSADMTTFTEAGYVGDDLEQILGRLVVAAGGDVKKAEKGIAFLDEADKIGRVSSDNGRDVKGEGVQQSLLKMLEGGKVFVDPNGNKKTSMPGQGSAAVEIDTTNILFILGGAFSGLTDKSNAKRTVGINSVTKGTHEIISHKDLIKYGLIPELMGRVPVIAKLEHLTEEDLVKILTTPRNAILKQYEAILELDRVGVEFSPEFIKEIAYRANMEGTGARGLRAILEQSLMDVMFNAPLHKGQKIIITKDYATGKKAELELVHAN